MVNWRKPVLSVLLAYKNIGILRNLRFIKKMSRWSHKRIKGYQRSELEKLILHAYKNVPYYTKVFDKAGVVKNDRVNMEAFNSIPILNKDIIRDNFESLKSRDFEKRHPILNHTGGSTGQPLTLYQDKNYYEWNIANKMFYAWFHGKDIGEKEMKLWGSDRDIIENTIGFKNILQFYLYNRKFINSFRFDNDQMEKTVREINSFKPKLLWGYVDSIYALSIFVKNQGLRIFNPPVIFTAAGTLYQSTRRHIKSVFQKSRIINVYGSRELGDMAFQEDEKGGLLVFDHSHLIDLVPLKPESKEKRIIVTSLKNYAMPLIRYDIGDVSTGFDKLSGDKAHFTKLKDVTGRVMTLFKRPDGGYVSPEFFIHMVGVYYNKGDIKQFQIIQKSISEIVVKVVPNGRLEKSTTEKVSSVIKKVMGDKVQIKYVSVKNIPKSKSGKYLYAVSEVK